MTDHQLKQFWSLLSPTTAAALARDLGRVGCKENDSGTFLQTPPEHRDEWNRGYCEVRWGQLS